MNSRFNLRTLKMLELALLWFVLPIARMSAQDPASDDFERATLGTNWTRFGGSAAEIVNGHDLGAPDPANWCFVGWTASTFDTDQFSEIVVASGKPGTMLFQVYVRRRASDLARYGFHFDDENGSGGIANPRWEIKYDGVPGPQTISLATVAATMPAPGDTLRIEATGTDPVVIKGFHNGQQVISVADTNHQRITTTGPVGMVSRLRSGPYSAPANVPIFASWKGGSLGPQLNIRRLDNSTLAVSFLTRANRTYVLESTASLSPAAWVPLSTFPGDGTFKSATITNSPQLQFLRVRLY
jgi:hypothetical protein